MARIIYHDDVERARREAEAREIARIQLEHQERLEVERARLAAQAQAEECQRRALKAEAARKRLLRRQQAEEQRRLLAQAQSELIERHRRQELEKAERDRLANIERQKQEQERGEREKEEQYCAEFMQRRLDDELRPRMNPYDMLRGPRVIFQR